MISDIFPNCGALKCGEFDNLFLAMKDLFLKLIYESGREVFQPIQEISSYKLPEIESELLTVCYTCVRYGVNPKTCEILIKSKMFNGFGSQQYSEVDVIRILIIDSMTEVFYMHDMNEFYLRAQDFCSPDILHELSKSIM